MKIKKSNLVPIFLFVKGTEGTLSLKESRERDIFIKPFFEVVKTYEQDREKIYKEFCIKNENGEPDLKDGKSYQFPTEKLDELNKELETLNTEEVEVNVYALTKEVLEKSEYKPKVGETEIIDEFLNGIN